MNLTITLDASTLDELARLGNTSLPQPRTVEQMAAVLVCEAVYMRAIKQAQEQERVSRQLHNMRLMRVDP